MQFLRNGLPESIPKYFTHHNNKRISVEINKQNQNNENIKQSKSQKK